MRSWFTALAIVACCGLYAGLAARNDYDSWETMAQFGYLAADAVWDGGWWALVTSALVHFEMWHLVFNVYWLWVLGIRCERAIGSLPMLAFFVASAFVSSSAQLATSGATGIGASGVVYAMFGFMWLSRERHPSFAAVLDRRTIRIFVLWLFGCIALTGLGIWNVGNAAHVGGLLFGGVVAGTLGLRRPRIAAGAAVAVLVALATVPLVWCPWSFEWRSHVAYAAHVAQDYRAALGHYDAVIRMAPDNAWAHLNRGMVHASLGDPQRAAQDHDRALELDPEIEKRE